MNDPAFLSMLQRAQSRDEDAHAEIWRDHHPQLVRYFTAAAGPDHADDLAADTWLHVVRGIDRFTGDATQFKAWLFTIARRRVLDHQRRAARRPATTVLDVDPVDPDGDHQVTVADLAAARALLDRLPDDQAEVLALRTIAGLDPATVAERTGRKPGNVRVIHHRAISHLAKLVTAASVLAVVVAGLAVAGRLPGPAQTVARNVLHRIGIEVPDPAAPPAPPTSTPTPTTTAAPSGPAPAAGVPPTAAAGGLLGPDPTAGAVGAPTSPAASPTTTTTTIPGTTTTTVAGGLGAGVSLPGTEIDATIPGNLDLELPGGAGVSVGDDGLGVVVPGPDGRPVVSLSVPPLLGKPRR